MKITYWCLGSSRTAIKLRDTGTWYETGQCAYCTRRVRTTLDGRIYRHVDERAYMADRFDAAQRAYDNNTEPPEPKMCKVAHYIVPEKGIEVIDHSVEWAQLQVHCDDCGAVATFSVDNGLWEL